jgi:integrase
MGVLDDLSADYGDWPYAGLNQRAVLKLRDQKAETPEAANARIKALRQKFKHAIAYGVEGIEADPTQDVGYLRSNNPDGHHAWKVDEVEQFEEAHPVGTKARLVLALIMYGGCARRSDVVRLGKPHVKKLKSGTRLQYTQFKGRNKNPIHIDIPMIPKLRRIIDASPCGDLTFLVTEFGRPFSSKGFGNWFKKRCVEADLPHCSAHGVRKAAAARLAELGCSDHEIMAIGGWKTLKEVQRYTKGARKQVLSNNAMDKVQADIDGTKVSNLSRDGG